MRNKEGGNMCKINYRTMENMTGMNLTEQNLGTIRSKSGETLIQDIMLKIWVTGGDSTPSLGQKIRHYLVTLLNDEKNISDGKEKTIYIQTPDFLCSLDLTNRDVQTIDQNQKDKKPIQVAGRITYDDKGSTYDIGGGYTLKHDNEHAERQLLYKNQLITRNEKGYEIVYTP